MAVGDLQGCQGDSASFDEVEEGQSGGGGAAGPCGNYPRGLGVPGARARACTAPVADDEDATGMGHGGGGS